MKLQLPEEYEIKYRGRLVCAIEGLIGTCNGTKRHDPNNVGLFSLDTSSLEKIYLGVGCTVDGSRSLPK